MPYATACGAYQKTFLTPTNQTPLTVSSTLPLEVVMQLFRRMGYVCDTFLLRSRVFLTHCVSISPRVILVEDFGTLAGLTTVKDVLHLEPHGQLNSPMIAWSNRGALDGALEELWTWLADVRSSANAWYTRVVSRRLR
jgi:chloride channel 3/4/5